METPTVSPAKSAMNFGVLLGLVMMILSLLTFVFELYDQTWLTYLSYAILIGGIVLGIKRHRDNERGGAISYGQSLGYGTMVSLFSGLIGAIMLFVYLSYVDDGFIQFNVDKQEAQFYEAGMPDEQIEQAMAMTEKFSSPIVYSVFGLLGTVFMGFIISLIVSAFLKKEPENFEDVA